MKEHTRVWLERLVIMAKVVTPQRNKKYYLKYMVNCPQYYLYIISRFKYNFNKVIMLGHIRCYLPTIHEFVFTAEGTRHYACGGVATKEG